jgi:hypothetical protein
MEYSGSKMEVEALKRYMMKKSFFENYLIAF